MAKKGARRRKRRTHVVQSDEAFKNLPKSFVFKKGRVTPSVRLLVQDLRKLMAPFTALRLREARVQKVRDFINVAGVFGVTHLVMLSQTDVAVYLRIARLPAGPSFTFRVHSYTLATEVRASQKRPRATTSDYDKSPLVVLNGFKEGKAAEGSGETAGALKLMTVMLSNMFPPIDVKNMQVGDCRRVVLFNYSPAGKAISMRHYAIVKRPAGMTRGVRKLLRTKSEKLVNLGTKTEVSDFVLSGGVGGVGDASDSEVEDAAQVAVPPAKREAQTEEKEISVSLIELGPRLTLQLIKAEEEMFAGKVLFHEYVKKTPDEMQQLDKKAHILKDRRKEQERLAERLAERQQRKMLKNKPAEEATAEDGGDAEADDEGDDNREDDSPSATSRSRTGATQPQKTKFNPFTFKAKKRKQAQEPAADGVPDGAKKMGGGRFEKQQAAVLARYHRSKEGAAGQRKRGNEGKDRGGPRKKVRKG
ncbi:unnamed protein product [Vitrella brassicaformis CCMP3155]|uniref:Brix domain-containing protein n=1 Tax=Vitrella brassicaformis (strain CCMP3155) TaxID=1169540 RepID=A0A0G4G217_VITBC|nr:unnamed protein product [Vitrella brassicaformis CCMP3155]|mmetsp:Transcript_22078/g.62981  ORF Transcript_22078/g.62981 Transcript_22078/m.62981 type:complete len:475 (-) Transcript_22078:2403-3827(-)|eukprot:CEM22015.1 unnamed protein product [Vitrella brassicaformis CCMP3155]